MNVFISDAHVEGEHLQHTGESSFCCGTNVSKERCKSLLDSRKVLGLHFVAFSFRQNRGFSESQKALVRAGL